MAQNKRQERLKARRKKERQGQLRNMALIGVAAVAIVGVIIWNNFRPVPPRLHPMEEDNRLGDPNAPVVLEEFADFQCTFCQNYYLETAEQVIEQFVATGDVYYIFYALPFLGQNSQVAAEATYCAGEQERFWDFHDNLFNNFATNLTPAGMISRARRLDLDVASFETCQNTGEMTERVSESMAYAQSLGVEGTPAFAINGQLVIEGAQPFDAFRQAIENALTQAVPAGK